MDVKAFLGEITDLLREAELDAAMARCQAAAADVGVSGSAAERNGFAVVSSLCTQPLGKAGRHSDVVAIVDLMRSVIRDDLSPKATPAVSVAILREATGLLSLGRTEAAIETYDDFLALDVGEKNVSHGLVVEALLAKHLALNLAQRNEEAVVVVDSALSAIPHATSASVIKRGRWAVTAALAKLEDLDTLGRLEDARDLSDQLSSALGDVEPPVQQISPEDAHNESSLARAVVEVLDSAEDAQVLASESTEALAERAVELYRISEPWAIPVAAEIRPADAAAALIRGVADGCAFLASNPDSTELEGFFLPHQAEPRRALLIDEADLKSWAKAHGHPFEVPGAELERHQAAGVVGLQQSEALYFDGRFVSHIVRLMYLYELISVLLRSPIGREALRGEPMRSQAESWFKIAVRASGRLSAVGEQDERTSAALIALFVARDLFALTHETASTRMRPTSPDALRDLVRESGAGEWLIQRGGKLPRWAGLRGI